MKVWLAVMIGKSLGSLVEIIDLNELESIAKQGYSIGSPPMSPVCLPRSSFLDHIGPAVHNCPCPGRDLPLLPMKAKKKLTTFNKVASLNP